MKIAVILVHYHAAELAAGACRALERDAAASDLQLDLVLVDNGSRPEDRRRLAALPARRIDPRANLGYAGGVNLGVRETSAEWVVVMNPDVEVLPGCLANLAAALAGGAAAAGPRLYWDRGRRFLLPPTEPVSRRAEVFSVLARRGGGWARRARRLWRRHAQRLWTAEAPLPSYDLSGALLAFRRSAWSAVGAFDEAYRLYFEETDWLRRLRRERLEARFVPAAEAVHLYAQSTVAEPRAEGWFLDSSRRFRRRAYGAAFARCLEWLSARVDTPAEAPIGPPATGASPQPAWLEVSASPRGYPAAAGRPSPEGPMWQLPGEVWGRLAPGRYFLRAVDEDGRESAPRVVVKGEGEAA